MSPLATFTNMEEKPTDSSLKSVFFSYLNVLRKNGIRQVNPRFQITCFKPLNVTNQRPRGGWSATPPSKSRRIFFLLSLKKLLEVKRGRGGRGGQTGGDGERGKNLLSRFLFFFISTPSEDVLWITHTRQTPCGLAGSVCVCECLSRW